MSRFGGGDAKGSPAPVVDGIIDLDLRPRVEAAVTRDPMTRWIVHVF
jgi:hypothetical protein